MCSCEWKWQVNKDCACAGCLDTLNLARQNGLCVVEEHREKAAATKVYSRDDFQAVNRFESEYQLLLPKH